jgi:hypothetical protein
MEPCLKKVYQKRKHTLLFQGKVKLFYTGLTERDSIGYAL